MLRDKLGIFSQCFLLSGTSRLSHGMPLVGLLFKLDVFLLAQDNLRGCEGAGINAGVVFDPEM